MQRLVVTGQRLGHAAQRLQGIAQVTMGQGLARLQTQGSLKMFSCPARIAGLQRQHAQQMSGLDILRLVFDDLRIKLFGLGETALLMQRESVFQHSPPLT